MEAGASALHRVREFHELGHDVRLIPPAYVSPCVKRGKTDSAEAEAICAAVTGPTMRVVAVKSREQQGALMLHKAGTFCAPTERANLRTRPDESQHNGVCRSCEQLRNLLLRRLKLRVTIFQTVN